MMAMMLVASATAFAGDSDALKAILKAKTYAEAEALLKSSVSSLANDAEKAKAYNKLVDLAYEKYKKEDDTRLTNQALHKNDPVDEAAMAEMAYNALAAAIECDKYDQLPNEKGKVAPKFDKKNAERLWIGPRNQLVNAGQEAAQKHDDDLTLKYWGMFLDSNEAKLFEAQDRAGQAEFIGQVAYFAGNLAHKAKLTDKAKKYFALCSADEKVDTQYKNAAHITMLNMMKEGLSTKADSLRAMDEFKQLYAQNSNDDLLMDVMYNFYGELNDKPAQIALLDEFLSRNPDNFIAVADKGLSMLNDNPAEAAKYLKKAAEMKSDNAAIQTYAGTALSMQAQAVEDVAQKKAIYTEAIKYYDKAKELDPDRLQSNWGYNRYNAYYNLYGEDAPETKQAEADMK